MEEWPTDGRKALAFMRLDRALEGQPGAEAITADGVRLTLDADDTARYAAASAAARES